MEAHMNEDVFNMELRKFLKKVGVTSQREIEQAVRAALESGALKGNETLQVKATLTIQGLPLTHDINGEISLS
jgi:ribosomal protein L1